MLPIGNDEYITVALNKSRFKVRILRLAPSKRVQGLDQRVAIFQAVPDLLLGIGIARDGSEELRENLDESQVAVMVQPQEQIHPKG